VKGTTHEASAVGKFPGLPDDSVVSTAVGATATTGLWVPVIAASIGATAAVLVGVVTQWWSGRRDRQHWEHEREDLREQWEHEREERREQWDRERAIRWLQDRQQAYARLIAALDAWDDALETAMDTRKKDAATGEHTHPEGYDAVYKTATEALAVVGLLASGSLIPEAMLAVAKRENFWRRLRIEDMDISKLRRDWRQLRIMRDNLMSAMRKDLEVDIRTGDQNPAGG
jgi:hypothetical protein